MSFLDLMEQKLKSQDEYEYEITRERLYWYFRLGNAVGVINWRDIMIADSPRHVTQHTEECIKNDIENRSMVCPGCGGRALVSYESWGREGESLYRASCKNCGWSIDTWDDEEERVYLINWLDEYDWPTNLHECDCPTVELPPDPESLVNGMYNSLYWKNHTSKPKVKKE